MIFMKKKDANYLLLTKICCHLSKAFALLNTNSKASEIFGNDFRNFYCVKIKSTCACAKLIFGKLICQCFPKIHQIRYNIYLLRNNITYFICHQIYIVSLGSIILIFCVSTNKDTNIYSYILTFVSLGPNWEHFLMWRWTRRGRPVCWFERSRKQQLFGL